VSPYSLIYRKKRYLARSFIVISSSSYRQIFLPEITIILSLFSTPFVGDGKGWVAGAIKIINFRQKHHTLRPSKYIDGKA
jgi:hypothetical protein